jgi:gamma-glutamyl-gamma-aminobutyrate hydrolase PuuD
MRIGITQRVVEVPHYQERRDSLDQRWAHVIIQLGGFPVPLSNGVAGYLAALDLAGVILSGGNDISCLEGTRDTAPERDEFEGKLVDTCLASGIALLGVCRGMQVAEPPFRGPSATGGRPRRQPSRSTASGTAARCQQLSQLGDGGLRSVA